MPYPVGINFGCSFSSVAVFRGGMTPEVIINRAYDRPKIPSVVYYNPTTPEVQVGQFEDGYYVRGRYNFVFDVKEMIGRKYDDPYMQDVVLKRRYGFKVVRGENDWVELQFQYDNVLKSELPEVILAEIFKSLKATASIYLGEEVTEAVIAIPPDFDYSQRNAVVLAAQYAGLTVLKLLSEPIAAAIHYNLEDLYSPLTLLVFDFGGGSLSVSVVDVVCGQFKVRGAKTDYTLGGKIFEKNLKQNLFTDTFQSLEYYNPPSHIRQFVLHTARKSAILIKHMLSTSETFTLFCTYLDRQDYPIVTNQYYFEFINREIFERAMDLVNSVLYDLKLSPENIDKVLLAGGSTNIPKIRKMLASLFGESKITVDVNPEDAVVLGAAVQAAFLKDEEPRDLEKSELVEPMDSSDDFEEDEVEYISSSDDEEEQNGQPRQFQGFHQIIPMLNLNGADAKCQMSCNLINDNPMQSFETDPRFGGMETASILNAQSPRVDENQFETSAILNAQFPRFDENQIETPEILNSQSPRFGENQIETPESLNAQSFTFDETQINSIGQSINQPAYQEYENWIEDHPKPIYQINPNESHNQSPEIYTSQSQFSVSSSERSYYGIHPYDLSATQNEARRDDYPRHSYENFASQKNLESEEAIIDLSSFYTELINERITEFFHEGEQNGDVTEQSEEMINDESKQFNDCQFETENLSSSYSKQSCEAKNDELEEFCQNYTHEPKNDEPKDEMEENNENLFNPYAELVFNPYAASVQRFDEPQCSYQLPGNGTSGDVDPDEFPNESSTEDQFKME